MKRMVMMAVMVGIMMVIDHDHALSSWVETNICCRVNTYMVYPVYAWH